MKIRLFDPEKKNGNGLTEDRQLRILYSTPTRTLWLPCDRDRKFDDILEDCCKELKIKPPHKHMFAFFVCDGSYWLNLCMTAGEFLEKTEASRSSHEDDPPPLEFRLRFSLNSEIESNGENIPPTRCSTGLGSAGKPFMNDVVTKYFFYQRRYDFVNGKLKLEAGVSDKTGAVLGVAVLDMLRLAKEMSFDLPTIRQQVIVINTLLFKLTFFDYLAYFFGA